ncbi:MAG: FecR domain-containing protein [Gemmatimonadetes bacterium]|nr:FecR domain-containing protein [Gemmatimonadota bacterium]
MEHAQIWESLARHYAGESSETEERALMAWAAEDPTRREILETARQAWLAAGSAAEPWDPGGAWDRVQARLAPAPSAPGRPSRFARFQPSREVEAHAFARRWAVAAIGAAMITGSLYWTLTSPAGDPAIAEELTTPKGERAHMRLSDGTRVILGPDSRLEIHADFERSAREVGLTGEAYFEVATDPRRPFIVNAGGTTTQVLGTEFDVRSYPADSVVRVVVGEGRVAFRPTAVGERGAAILSPGDLGELAAGSRKVSVRRVDPDRYIAWRNGKLAFDDAPLSQVAVELERWYGVPVQIADPSLRTRRLTASFRDQPVDEVIAVIAASLGLDFRKIGNMFTFFPKGRLSTFANSR